MKGVGRLFKKLQTHCTQFRPRERPAIGDVVQRLEEIVKSNEERQKLRQVTRARGLSLLPTAIVSFGQAADDRKDKYPCPWARFPKLTVAIQNFGSKIEDPKIRAKFEKLYEAMGNLLGESHLDATTGG